MEEKTAFIIGTGPSLNDIDISKLKDYDCVTFNRAYVAFDEWGFSPKYYLSIDGNDIRSMYKDIRKLAERYRSTSFFILDDEHYNSIHPESSFQDNDKMDVLFDWGYENLYKIMDSKNLGPFEGKVTRKTAILPIVSNSGWVGIELLYALGYKEIAFVGCDARYKDDEESNKDIVSIKREYISSADTDMNHFREDYFGKGIHFGKPNPKEIIDIWSKNLNHIPSDLKIYSCTKDSALNPWYEYIEFNEFINGNRKGEIV